jgi:hypothetical protein
MNKTFLISIGLLMASGCARFSTSQRDERTNEKTGETTTITTKAAAWTFFDSKSQLTTWKAQQQENDQSAEVGSLTQESYGTNATELIKAVAEGVVRGITP